MGSLLESTRCFIASTILNVIDEGSTLVQRTPLIHPISKECVEQFHEDFNFDDNVISSPLAAIDEVRVDDVHSSIIAGLYFIISFDFGSIYEIEDDPDTPILLVDIFRRIKRKYNLSSDDSISAALYCFIADSIWRIRLHDDEDEWSNSYREFNHTMSMTTNIYSPIGLDDMFVTFTHEATHKHSSHELDCRRISNKEDYDHLAENVECDRNKEGAYGVGAYLMHHASVKIPDVNSYSRESQPQWRFDYESDCYKIWDVSNFAVCEGCQSEHSW